MKDIDYGISDVVVGNDNISSTVVKLGDGATRITTAIFDCVSGVQLCRSENLDNEPFKVFTGDEADAVNHLPDDDKVYILFDNPASIDVIVTRLIEAKLSLEK